jgi:hypothetical protein
MRITKLPIPLLIAAAALTSVVVIYVYLTAPPMPIHTDRNFTQPLYGGVTYLWRGAAFEYIFSADTTITVANETAYHLIYLFGPLYNISIAGKVFILYGAGIRPLYVYKLPGNVPFEGGVSLSPVCFVFKLEDITPGNMSIANLTLYLPRVFGENEFLTSNEDSAIDKIAGYCSKWRVISMASNGTHIIYRVRYTTSASGDRRYLIKLSAPVTGKTIRVLNQPLRGVYVVGDVTYPVMALPYLYFAITPSETTTLTIYVR